MNWLLVEDGVEQIGGLAGLTVTNDQFALATANRDQRINSLEAGLPSAHARTCAG